MTECPGLEPVTLDVGIPTPRRNCFAFCQRAELNEANEQLHTNATTRVGDEAQPKLLHQQKSTSTPLAELPTTTTTTTDTANTSSSSANNADRDQLCNT